jgi:hypothetical protein
MGYCRIAGEGEEGEEGLIDWLIDGWVFTVR